jgi:hypothetical protein
MHAIGFRLCLLLICGSSFSSFFVVVDSLSTAPASLAASTTQTRRSVLVPWTAVAADTSTNTRPLGWAIEERTTNDGRIQATTVGWGDESGERVVLPQPSVKQQQDVETATDTDILASSQWPAGLAGAILCRSEALQNVIQGKNILELGSGLGLMGLSAAAVSEESGGGGRVTLTDHDECAVATLQQAQGVSARVLDWGADHSDNKEKFEVIMGSDIAYYFYLLRPIMDTVMAHLHVLPSTQEDNNTQEDNSNSSNQNAVIIFGGANRQSQWDLYDNIRNGCYNQRTDEREVAWPGTTKMILYKLKTYDWDDPNSKPDILPIAMLIHSEAAGTMDFLSGGDSDHHEATDAEKEDMDVSF